MSLANPPARPGSAAEFFRGLDVQAHVIGALILRELHTRYGRDNIGYLWMLADPMMLALAVVLIHLPGGMYRESMPIVPFVLGGYTVFIIFRGIIGRAESTLEANQPLLYHRTVSIFDMLFARAVLEGAACFAALVILLGGAFAAGLAAPPARPLTFLGSVLFMTWVSFGLSMLVCAMGHASKTAGRLVHPVVYVMFPLSGCFYTLKSVPEPYRHWIGWSPFNQIFEMLRTGLFENIDSPYYHPPYLFGVCMTLTLLGMFTLRVLRRRVHVN